jgi:hypothetical protein
VKLGVADDVRKSVIEDQTIGSRCYRNDAGETILQDTGPPISDPASVAWLKSQQHLMPRPHDTPLAKRAFVENNITARGQLLKEVGKTEADRIAKHYGLRGLDDPRRGKAPAADTNGEKKKNGHDGRANPWSREGWSVTEQEGCSKCSARRRPRRWQRRQESRSERRGPSHNTRGVKSWHSHQKTRIASPPLVADMPVNHISHGMSEQTKPGNIARSGAPKRVTPVAVHSAMHARTRSGDLVVGQTLTSLANAPDASGARPLDPTVNGKAFVGKGVPPVVGHRSRTVNDTVHGGEPGQNWRAGVGNLDHSLGKAILDEAFAASATDDCRAHGRE